VACSALLCAGCAPRRPGRREIEIEKTDAEWRAQLTPQQYEIRQEGTERPGSSPLLKEHRKGLRLRRLRPAAVFLRHQVQSGTGGRASTSRSKSHRQDEDRTFGYCAPGALPPLRQPSRPCFDDGPKPTGLRYCIDGFALVFHPAAPSATYISPRHRCRPGSAPISDRGFF
jgi:peptide-methionine (R)-S-oxide reductase